MPKKGTKKVRGHTRIGTSEIFGMKYKDPFKVTKVKPHFRKKWK